MVGDFQGLQIGCRHDENASRRQVLGPHADGLIVLLNGGLVWVAAGVFVVSAALMMLIRTRARVSKKTFTGNGPERGGGAPATANREAPSASLERVAAEEPGRNGRALAKPASEPGQDDGSNVPQISVEEAPDKELLVVPSSANVSVSDDHDVDVLVPVGEEAPTPAPIKPNESRLDIAVVPVVDAAEGTTVEIAPIVGAHEEEASGSPGNGDAASVVERLLEELPASEEEDQAGDTGETVETGEPEHESEGAGEEVAAVEAKSGSETGEAPARYRAPVLTPGRMQRSKASRPVGPEGSRQEVLELRIRAVCDRYGFGRFQMVAQRQAGAPPRMEARAGRRTLLLSEVAEDWFEVGAGEDLPTIMESGVRLTASTGDRAEASWELRGRDLFVLAELHGIFGFVSTTRLSIGRRQIVVCRENRGAEVRAILAQAGCDGVQERGTDFGAPSGWVFFAPLNPSRSVPQVPGDDVLNLIRPIPEVEIRLESGLWLRGSSWIAGYAPKVHITGEMPPGTEVMIDGEAAQEREERIYVTANSERPGNHTVWCAGKSAGYEICDPDVHWQEWKNEDSSYQVYGAAVAETSNAREGLISVPTSNPVLVGANPGELFRCDKRPGKQWTGPVPFPACWALPEDALHCDRSLRLVMLVNPIAPIHCTIWRYRKTVAPAGVLQWCHAIRDCQRKGLALSPENAATEQLWRSYVREARAVWRAAR